MRHGLRDVLNFSIEIIGITHYSRVICDLCAFLFLVDSNRTLRSLMYRKLDQLMN